MSQEVNDNRRPVPSASDTTNTASRKKITVWLYVATPQRSNRLRAFLRELAAPDFALEACGESARLDTEPHGKYRAHWHCSFLPRRHDAFAVVRLLKRLTGAGFDVLGYQADPDPLPLTRAA